MDTLLQFLGAGMVLVGGLVLYHFFNPDRMARRLLDRARVSALSGLDAYNDSIRCMPPTRGGSAKD
ncbi:hypothetical protein [Burkholderia cepacia]|uniref:Uncharacterized protein n=1 Tax=Burkholderia cepacia TaxID=292 RepID=A0AAX2RK83_BURCE|nr:hypothetical protein [Burkholderia cepacia]TES99585.1 hypothetical protein E3D36_24145 [Burkholderia cepacia]TEU41578.1 hypothetical protein E3D37_26530 [Burkholderia cepacia]TEU48795.1 hypothetical protein E3D38_21605 [Burkholderia cepacia]TEU95319.1 hypothetical protein E3D40_24620 [Burkholderia cepacia]TEV04713.1 hypothetical protein E3D44_26145 [Burkholderia cepacia]